MDYVSLREEMKKLFEESNRLREQAARNEKLATLILEAIRREERTRETPKQ